MTIHVLIGELEPPIAEELKGILEKLGYKIAGISHSSEETLRAAQTLHPDVVVVNMRKKGRAGITQTGSLINNQYNVPVVYCVDTASQDTIHRSGSVTSFGYIFQPFDAPQIQATMETAIIHHGLEHKIEVEMQYLNTILVNIGEGVIVVNGHGVITFINPAAEKIIGLHHSEAMEKSIDTVFVISDGSSNARVGFDALEMLSSAAGQMFSGQTLRVIARNGARIPVAVTVSPVRTGQGRKDGFVIVLRDITELQRAMGKLRQQANRAEALLKVASQLKLPTNLDILFNNICGITSQAVESSGTAILLLDQAREVFVSRAGHINDGRLQHYKNSHYEVPSHILEALLTDQRRVVLIRDTMPYANLGFWDEDLRRGIKCMILAALFRRTSLIGVLVTIFTDENRIVSPEDLSLLEGLADQASMAIESANLFERVREGRERQRMLAKSLVEIQETERRHIARELHDHLGQELTGLMFMLEMAKNQSPEASMRSLDEIRGFLGETIEKVREISLNLRPSMLDDLGLFSTLQWHLERYASQTGIQVEFQTDETVRRFPPDVETAGFRIIQEALTNCARYANVKNVFVGLTVHEETLWIEVLDHGKGFDLSGNVIKPTTGLGGMRERADMVGGYLIVRSYPNQGTQVTAALPLNGKTLERRKSDINRAFS